MRWIIAILGGLLGALSWGSTATAQQEAGEPTVRVLSYNIHHGEGVDGRLDLQRIADVILSVRPDIVALQEVDQGAERSGGVDQPAELARLTGMEVVFGGNIPLQGGHYGNAVLTRFPIEFQENHRLPNVDDGEQRGVLEAHLRLPASFGDRPLRVLATHLDHRRAEEERLASADQINALVARDPQRPALLVGDLNAVPTSETLRRFEAVWRRANEEILPTIPVDTPQRQIDYVMVYPPNRWRTVEVQVLDEPIASDHRPILAVLRWEQGDPR